MSIRVRVIVEYDSEETVEYEKAAWLNGDIELSDLLLLKEEDPSIEFKVEEVK